MLLRRIEFSIREKPTIEKLYYTNLMNDITLSDKDTTCLKEVWQSLATIEASDTWQTDYLFIIESNTGFQQDVRARLFRVKIYLKRQCQGCIATEFYAALN